VNDRAVEAAFVFDRHAATDLSVAYASWCHSGGPVSGPARKEGRPVAPVPGVFPAGVFLHHLEIEVQAIKL
jgi:hypothetical protein